MARTKSVCCVAAMLALSATAQRITSTSPTPTEAASSTTLAPPSSITESPDHTMGIPMSLWSVATSLLTRYYPSTTITNLRELTWPGTMVIGDKTYTIRTGDASTSMSPLTESTGTAQDTSKTHNTLTTSTSPAASDFGSVGAVDDSPGKPDDRTVSIIIGVVVGVVAFTIMGVIFFCLHRRRKATGSFFLRRSTPSPMPWRPPHEDPESFGTVSYVTVGQQDRQPKLPQVSMMQRGHTPPLNMHPAALHEQSSRSTSDDNPFLTPQERSTAYVNELDGQEVRHVELDHAEPAQRRSTSSVRNSRESRPPTPFSPLMMMQMPGPAQKPKIHVNPFASPEDREADDVVSPIVPTRSPERRYSPMVHYPSWDEVSEFNFSGDERERPGPPEDGGDGYRFIARERKDGRYELA